ncbi:MAG: tetratricopeptide repeat protein [Magnetococcales bacterium]|nr:tetratricopeptide repeat protein [Magnetococcales bacterium]
MDIFEEVDEELEAERLRKFWQKYHNWLIGGFVLLFAGLSAYVGWENYQESRDHDAAARYLKAWDAFEKKNTDESLKGVDDLLQAYGDHGYSVLGQLLKARLQADDGQRDQALSTLISLSKSTEAPNPVKNLALLNAAYLTADKPEQALDYLKRIDSDSIFQAHSLELQGLFAAKKGDQEVALDLYQQAQEKSAPGAISKRLTRRIQRLAGPETPEPEPEAESESSDEGVESESSDEGVETIDAEGMPVEGVDEQEAIEAEQPISDEITTSEEGQ